MSERISIVDKIHRLEARLSIDKHALDEALREHPELFYDVANELAWAISERDGLKQDLDELVAEVDKNLRRSAEISGDKVTEKAIENSIKLERRVAVKTDEYLQSKHDCARWQALKEAFEQRSYALSKLVELHLASYFSDREVSGKAAYDRANADNIKRQLAERRVTTL